MPISRVERSLVQSIIWKTIIAQAQLDRQGSNILLRRIKPDVRAIRKLEEQTVFY